MISCGYIIIIIVDSCMIIFHFDCIMQLKKSYHFDTNFCSRKSATTFGDLPDCLWDTTFYTMRQGRIHRIFYKYVNGKYVSV